MICINMLKIKPITKSITAIDINGKSTIHKPANPSLPPYMINNRNNMAQVTIDEIAHIFLFPYFLDTYADNAFVTQPTKVKDSIKYDAARY